MTKQLRFIFFTPLLLLVVTGCIPEGDLQPIIPKDYLNDNSSKVWLVVEETEGGKDYSPFKREKKQTFLFFDDGTFYVQQLGDWGTGKFYSGTYIFSINNRNSELQLDLDYGGGNKVGFWVLESLRNRFVLEYKDIPGRKIVLTTITKPER